MIASGPMPWGYRIYKWDPESAVSLRLRRRTRRPRPDTAWVLSVADTLWYLYMRCTLRCNVYVARCIMYILIYLLSILYIVCPQLSSNNILHASCDAGHSFLPSGVWEWSWIAFWRSPFCVTTIEVHFHRKALQMEQIREVALRRSKRSLSVSSRTGKSEKPSFLTSCQNGSMW